jgi:hypothetical protein
VTAVRITRGATRTQGALTRTEAGSAAVTLLDAERRFDPIVNADAVHPGVRVRVRAWAGSDPAAPDWSAVLFTGRIGADLDVAYQRVGPPVVSFTASDVVARLALFSSIGRPDPGVGDGDDLLGRVGRIVTEVGLPADAVGDDVDADYAATMPATTLARGWEGVSDAVDAELGRVWVTADDRIVTRARGSQLSGPVRGTLSDWHEETVGGDEDAVHCCYTDAQVRMGTESLTNRVIAARRVPSTGGGTPPASAVVQVDDVYSQARWSGGVPVVHEDRSLELSTDGQLQPWAEWLLLASSEPELRVDSVAPAPWAAGPEAWRAVCETDLGDRWGFRLHPQIGPQVARTVGVLGIEHDITPGGWEVRWSTTEAPTPGEENPGGWFVLDVSELDGGDVLAPFDVPVP